VGEQVAHHLHESLRGDDVGHPLGVLLGEGEEQGVLVAVVVEDRAAGEPGALLQAADGRALVAETREAGAGAVEDLLPPGGEVVAADPGHLVTLDVLARRDGTAVPRCPGAGRRETVGGRG